MDRKKTLFAILCLFGIWCAPMLTGQTSNTSYAKEDFNDKEVFPGWNQTMNSQGKKILGTNGGGKSALGNESETRGAVLLIPKVIEFILGALAPLAIVMTIWSGVLFVTAGGDEESISKAKRFFMYAVIGFVFIIISFTLVKIGTSVLKG